jgi:signal transduction histidine kinase
MIYKKISPKPLFLKFVITLPLVTVVFWLISALVTARLLNQNNLSEFAKSNSRYISTLGKQLINDIKYADYYQIRRILYDTYDPAYMEYLAFYTSDLKPIAIFPSQVTGKIMSLMDDELALASQKNMTEHFFNRDLLNRFHFQFTVQNEQGSPLGYLIMGGTTTHLNDVVRKQVISFIMLGFVVLLLQIITIIYFSHIITLPLRKVTQLMTTAEMENPDNLIDTALEATDIKGSSRETALFLSVYQKLLKRIQEHIQLKKEMALHAAIGRMASHLAHDIRSPLASINTFLNQDLKIDDTMNQMREAAKRSLQKLIHMSEDLVDYAKARETRPQLTDICALLKDSAHELSHLTSPKQIEISIDCKTPVSARLDQHKFSRVITNIFMNAIQSIDINAVDKKIRVSAEIRNGNLLLKIADTGCGIEPHNLPYIFDSSFTFGKPGGSGLGLSYCKNVVEAHGGKIEAESESKKGTTFIITLPINSQSAPPKENEITEAVNHYQNALSNGASTILIVDDDPEIRKRLREIIVKLTENPPIELSSGEELLSMPIDFSKIKIAISDHKFENCALNGIDVLQYLKRKNVPMLILCTSMSENPEVRKAAENIGVKHILSKPINEESVRKIIG